MKSWTLMLIPQGQGNTRSVNVSTFHLWTGIACVAVAAFAITFYYQRTIALQERLMAARAQVIAADTAKAVTKPERVVPVPAPTQPATGATADRAQYEAALEVLRNELDAVLQLEDQVRDELKLEPRKKSPTGFVSQALGSENGRGGPPISGASLEVIDERPTRPHSLIEAVANPSADMILAELTLRRDSVRDLLLQIDEIRRAEKAAAEEKARAAAAATLVPSRWPSDHGRTKVTSRYGNRRDPFTRKLRHHDGIDFSAPYGTNVLATADGKVVKAGWTRYLGYMVEIQHTDGLSTVYGHMSKLTVSKGQAVTAGHTIGKVGSTGRSTGPHIHYEIHRNGRHINPSKYVKK